MDELKRLTVTVTQGTRAWAFLAASQALRRLHAAGILGATVRLFEDGSGELRIPQRERALLAGVPDLADLVGSVRVDYLEAEDLVIQQCQGFAYRELTAEEVTR